MSKKMTPCEKLGYEVGDKFEVISHHAFKKGQVVTLHKDDGTECPLFAGDGGGAGVFDGVECSFATLNQHVRKIANKLKPAKQALADAIHQNGGWPESELLDFATSNAFGEVLCSASHPERKGNVWVNGDYYRLISCIKGTIANWHQTVLSRDEYFTAYPEEVKVEVNNETERKVEVEMTSESEVTINASDWHKNGELPPVGEVCEMKHKHSTADWARPGFEPVVIIASGKDLFIVSGTDVYREVVGSWDEYEFRPFSSERDKAIDEMVCEFIDHYGNPKGGERYLGIASKLYDAGYRKEVKL